MKGQETGSEQGREGFGGNVNGVLALNPNTRSPTMKPPTFGHKGFKNLKWPGEESSSAVLNRKLRRKHVREQDGRDVLGSVLAISGQSRDVTGLVTNCPAPRAAGCLAV